jgi:hypothetical protein
MVPAGLKRYVIKDESAREIKSLPYLTEKKQGSCSSTSEMHWFTGSCLEKNGCLLE